MAITQNICKVISNEKLCSKFFRICLDAQSIQKKAKPGQFVHIRVCNGLKPFFRRPFSIYRSSKHLEVLYEVVGCGTKALSLKKKGDALDVMGPIGTPFLPPSKIIKQVVMIAGGVGVAPFLSLSDQLKKRNCELILLYGGRTKGHTFNMKEFKNNGCKIFVSTDDGSRGIKGRVSKLFTKINKDPETTFIYTCGPRPMMASVVQFANRYGIKGQASHEEVMACGVGACLGCSISTTAGYKTVCTDGPVFDLEEMVL